MVKRERRVNMREKSEMKKPFVNCKFIIILIQYRNNTIHSCTCIYSHS